MALQTETIKIDGMSCGHCVRSVGDALVAIEGVQVEDVRIGSAQVSYDPNRTNRDQVEHAIEEAGFKVAQ